MSWQTNKFLVLAFLLQYLKCNLLHRKYFMNLYFCRRNNVQVANEKCKHSHFCKLCSTKCLVNKCNNNNHSNCENVRKSGKTLENHLTKRKIKCSTHTSDAFISLKQHTEWVFIFDKPYVKMRHLFDEIQRTKRAIKYWMELPHILYFGVYVLDLA